METSHFLRPRLQLLARALPRPSARLNLRSRPSKMAIRPKSGPYGYTQAKALVYSKCGEPSEALR